MNKAEKLEDIQNRYTLALVERSVLEPGTENYNTLSEVARKILTEYQNKGRSRKIRYGFRLYGSEYYLVTLMKHEKY
jgi:hypothetical protein